MRFLIVLSLLIFLLINSAPLIMGNSNYEVNELEISIKIDGDGSGLINWTSEGGITLNRYENPLQELATKRCLEGNKMNLLCLKIMSNRLNFTYKEDLYGDILYSPNTFIKNRGGDCEDWAVYMGTLIENKEIIGWKNSTKNSIFNYGPEKMIAKGVEFIDAGKLDSVVCIKRTNSTGHCQLLTTKNYLIEAYTGEIIGTFNHRNCEKERDIDCVYKIIPRTLHHG